MKEEKKAVVELCKKCGNIGLKKCGTQRFEEEKVSSKELTSIVKSNRSR